MVESRDFKKTKKIRDQDPRFESVFAPEQRHYAEKRLEGPE